MRLLQFFLVLFKQCVSRDRLGVSPEFVMTKMDKIPPTKILAAHREISSAGYA